MGIWLKRIGLLSVLAFPAGVALFRIEALAFHQSLMVIQGGAIVGAVVFVVGLIYALVVRNSRPDFAKAALIGALVAVVPVLALMMQAYKANTLPFIHNVTTDITDAPKFDKIAEIRTESDNPHHFDPNQQIGDTGTLGQLQQEAYPHLQTLTTDLSVAEAIAKSESIARSFGWKIVASNAESGLLEATETTTLWGFKDDIVVRAQSVNGQTEVDLRSVSRFGGSDLGANAARIERFSSEFEK